MLDQQGAGQAGHRQQHVGVAQHLGLLAGLFGQVLPVRAGVGARLQAGDLLQAQFDGLGRIAQVIHQAVGVVVLAGGAEGADHRGGDYPGEAADGVEPGRGEGSLDGRDDAGGEHQQRNHRHRLADHQ